MARQLSRRRVQIVRQFMLLQSEMMCGLEGPNMTGISSTFVPISRFVRQFLDSVLSKDVWTSERPEHVIVDHWYWPHTPLALVTVNEILWSYVWAHVVIQWYVQYIILAIQTRCSGLIAAGAFHSTSATPSWRVEAYLAREGPLWRIMTLFGLHNKDPAFTDDTATAAMSSERRASISEHYMLHGGDVRIMASRFHVCMLTNTKFALVLLWLWYKWSHKQAIAKGLLDVVRWWADVRWLLNKE